MTREEMIQVVIQSVITIQSVSGRAVPNITPATRPLTALPGFDSQNALEAGMLMEPKVGIEIDIYFFWSRERQEHSVEEIADLLLEAAVC